MTREEHLLRLENGYARYQADIPDTWIFEDRQIDTVGIAGPDHQPLVTLECPQFPMLAVWANRNGSFICLEPWFGRTDDEGFTGSIAEKKGIESLEGGEKTTGFLSLLDFHGENLTPGRWRLCMRYGVGEDLSRDWEAYAEFDVVD